MGEQSEKRTLRFEVEVDAEPDESPFIIDGIEDALTCMGLHSRVYRTAVD